MKLNQIICLAVVAAALGVGSTSNAQSTQSTYEGFTEPRYDIMVAATEIGRLEEVFVKIGDRVTKGQELARLEDTLQNSAVKIAKLQTQMQGELNAAFAEALLQRARRDQIRELAAESIARPNELMRAEADVRVAEARNLAATEQETLRHLELERAQLQLARRRVTAPMAGVISKIYHLPGEYATPADPAVVRLLVVDQLFAVFNVPADEVAALSVGSRVRVFLRGSSKTASGQIHLIAPDIDGESGTVQVKVALDNQDGKLRAGDRCTMQIAPTSDSCSARRRQRAKRGGNVDSMISGNPSSPIIAAPDREAAMHVSLVGQSDQEADGAPSESQSKTSASAATDTMPRLLLTIEAIARANNRSRAVEGIVGAMAAEFPDASLRCGLGSQRMKRFFDRKLGWLGPESSLHNAAEAKWADLPSDHADCYQFDGGVAVCLPEIDGDGRCVVWIESDQIREDSLDWIAGGLQTLQVVFWQRSVRSWLRPMKSLGLVATVWLSLAMAVLLLIAIWPIQYRIGCTAIVEPVQQRLVATPFEATLLKNHVRPGDAVRAGDVLVELDGRPLRLELESIESQIQQESKQEDISLVAGKIAEAQQASLKQRQLSRQRDLLADRLNRLEVVSPIDGVIVAGDLDRYIGSPLKLGQTLVEVAPLDRMVIQIEIPEHEIGYVQNGAESKIKIASIGGRSIRASLDDLYPTAEIRDDRNVFIGRTEVDNSDGQLRPGMRGKATTYGPLRPIVWSWVRGAYEKILWWAGY